MEIPTAKPQKEHEFLNRIVGDWIMTASSGHEAYDPNDPEQVFIERCAPSVASGSSARAPEKCLTVPA